jgi:hypothetical protein
VLCPINEVRFSFCFVWCLRGCGTEYLLGSGVRFDLIISWWAGSHDGIVGDGSCRLSELNNFLIHMWCQEPGASAASKISRYMRGHFEVLPASFVPVAVET